MKKLAMIVVYIISAFVFSITAFININPEFGANPSSKQKKIYAQYENYSEGEFINLEETVLMTEEMSFSDFFKDDSNKTPERDIIPNKISFDSFSKNETDHIKVAWLGHSAFILNMSGKVILLDPMLGQYAAPVPLPSLKRYSSELAISAEDLDSIDVVIFSHDHYDHLDRGTIKKIKDKVKLFIVPIGVGNHLRSWGVEKAAIKELNWSENTIFDDLEIVCLPSRHFSGRGPFNRNSTLWSSWAIKSKQGKIYFSGDSGYGSHFKSIGEEHGPFDLTLLDCAQYNSAWKYSHMFPEQAIQAAKDLNSKRFMPIHWGAFTLSVHAWDEPVKRAIKRAGEVGQDIVVPSIGKPFYLDDNTSMVDNWWEFY